MAIAFSRSMRSLKADSRSRRAIWLLLVAGAVLTCWVAWFLRARVSRYEVTDHARLEVDRAVSVLQAPIAGRIISSALVLDRHVAAGETLLEIEAGPQQLELREAEARLASLDPQLKSLNDEIAAQQRAQQAERGAGRAALEQARAQLREAEAQAHLADDEAARIARLNAEHLIAQRELVRAEAEQRTRRAAVEAMESAGLKLEREQQTNDHDRDARIEQLRSQITRLEADRNVAAKTIDRLAYEVRRRRVVAPVSGRLGEVAVLRTGGYVEEGDKVGAIVPDGRLRVVAEFEPPAALGRIRAGQRARLRLEGFPWMQFGAIPVTVSRVGSEVRNGRVRVELGVDPLTTSIPLQHGLPGTVEVQVEDISPAVLVLRAAGQFVASPKSPFGAARQ